MLAGLTLFFLAFCASFDFKYPIYCNPDDFRKPDRLDNENKMTIEEKITDCENNGTYFVTLGWNLIHIIVVIIPFSLIIIIAITIIFNHKNTKTKE
jgi:hypothetical protein